MIKWIKNMPYERKKKIYGFIFVLPWIIGFALFFFKPLFTSLIYSFQNLEMEPDGITGTFIGWDNYKYALFNDPNFIRESANSVIDMVYSVPLIIVYSLFVAVLLKDNFKGRGLMRAIAFLPVIIASGVLMEILKEEVFSQGVRGGGENVYLFSGGGINGILTNIGVNQQIIDVINNVINRIFDLTWKSGVQILLFLGGLHSIPRHLYESSSIDGARAWEQFWKITLPILTPIILLNVVYTLVDSFTDYGNSVILMIYNTAFSQIRFGYSSALSWLYFLIIVIFLGIVYLLLRKRIIYMED